MRACVILAALVLCGPARSGAYAQAAPAPVAAPRAFMALSVARLPPMIAWYRDVLGFTVFSQGEVADRGIAFALLLRDGALIEMLQTKAARPLKEVAPAVKDPVEIHGFFKGGFVVADVEAAYRDLQRRGVTFDFELTQPRNGPYRAFGLRDPEGNLLQVFGK